MIAYSAGKGDFSKLKIAIRGDGQFVPLGDLITDALQLCAHFLDGVRPSHIAQWRIRLFSTHQQSIRKPCWIADLPMIPFLDRGPDLRREGGIVWDGLGPVVQRAAVKKLCPKGTGFDNGQPDDGRNFGLLAPM